MKWQEAKVPDNSKDAVDDYDLTSGERREVRQILEQTQKIYHRRVQHLVEQEQEDKRREFMESLVVEQLMEMAQKANDMLVELGNKAAKAGLSLEQRGADPSVGVRLVINADVLRDIDEKVRRKYRVKLRALDEIGSKYQTNHLMPSKQAGELVKQLKSELENLFK